jgi:hypothetical protein
MRLKKAFFLIALVLFSLALASLCFASGIPDLLFFHSPSCHECQKAKTQILPQIEKEFKGRLRIEYRDISEMEGYLDLLSLEKEYNVEPSLELPVFFLKGKFLSGKTVNMMSLRKFVRETLDLAEGEKEGARPKDLAEHFKAFTPLAIISAGLIDGINPCAFTVIVFFISFLFLQGYSRKDIAIIGLLFILAVFLTYLLIGIGLFSFLYRLSGFWLVTKIFNLFIGVSSLILGGFAVYDLYKYRQGGSTEGLILQLPQAVKNQIHRIIGWHYRKTDKVGDEGKSQKAHMWKLALSALTCGFLVSLLEAVCTGQTYVPTIAFIIKTNHQKMGAFGYLLLYNAMFIVPLLLIFLLALLGVTSMQFSHFLKRHLVTGKLLMAVLFFSLGIFLIWRA